MSKLILLGLNEINFDYVQHYCQQGLLPSFQKLLNTATFYQTESESEYKLLEPWIQWPTIYTGKTYQEHQVFRLGDMVERKDLKQIFEIIEEKGFAIGAISPFNVDNRLKQPAFFVPDPWTKTKTSGPKWLQKLAQVISSLVNNNASKKVTPSAILTLLSAMLRVIPPKRYGKYISQVFSLKSKVGTRAIILDMLLADLFFYLHKKYNPDFSYLFLNTGAHFQHHYLFNSAAYDGKLSNPEWYCPKNQDPLLRILEEYDNVIARLQSRNQRILICTGLHQVPHKESTFYWRLKNHEDFLNANGFKGIKNVKPRMSRDFLVEFTSEELAKTAQNRFESYHDSSTQIPIFTVDNRGDSLFVELTYPNDIQNDFVIHGENTINNFKESVAFVAIKNGEHNGVGYVVDSVQTNMKGLVPLKTVYNQILNVFSE